MRRLYISLLSTLVVALFSLGWLLDQVFYSLNDSASLYSQHKAFAQGIAAQLETLSAEARQHYISEHNQYFLDRLTLLETASVVFPSELIDQVNTTGLVLASEQGANLLIKVDDDLMLSMLLATGQDSQATSENQKYLLTIGLYLGLCLLATLWLTPLIRRLRKLDNAANTFANGHLDHRIKVSSRSYVQKLELSFNRMAQQIDSLIQDNKLMSGALAHDLRHPIARSRFTLETLRMATSEEQKEKQIALVESDLDQLESMINDYLEYSRIQRHDFQLSREQIELVDWLEQTCTSFKRAHSDIDISLNHSGMGALQTLNADREWVQRCLNNLMTNAAQSGATQVCLRLQTSARFIALSVEDNGPGINQEIRDSLFKPFVHYQQSAAVGSTASKPGRGLGLAIVWQIMQWHGGSISCAKNLSFSGAAFRLEFPHQPINDPKTNESAG